jgi:hypothetical protein
MRMLGHDASSALAAGQTRKSVTKSALLYLLAKETLSRSEKWSKADVELRRAKGMPTRHADE